MNTRIIALALGLACSPWVLAAGDGNHDHSQHKGMDHSQHKGMDHSKMDHSQHQGMDHSKMDHSQHKGMDHSKMDHGQHKGMDHSKMNHSQHKGMDHSKMDHSQHKGMDQPKMDHSQHKGMDHSKMDHSQHKGMDHSKMDHSQHDRFADFKKPIPVSDGSAEDDIPMPHPGAMHMEDDPTLSKVMIHKFETQAADGENPLVLEAEAWIGKDLNKLWFKTEVEKTGSEVEHAELQVLYSKAISPYWDLQTGLRKDFQPEGREWLALGVKGLAPYYIDIDAALFAGDNGRTAARLKAEKEIMLTQKTALLPELELNLYGKDDPAMGIGSGLSDAKVGLRLLHEVRREFAPYIGVEWSKKFGGTAEHARDHGESTEDTRAVVGIHGWF